MAGPSLAQNTTDATLLAQAGGSRSERAIKDVPAIIDAITGKDLHPTRLRDIRDLVRDVPHEREARRNRAQRQFGASRLRLLGRHGNGWAVCHWAAAAREREGQPFQPDSARWFTT